jgi:hypothetical protein
LKESPFPTEFALEVLCDLKKEYQNHFWELRCSENENKISSKSHFTITTRKYQKNFRLN